MKFSVSKVPNKIVPCPIREAVFELRFETDIPSEIIPGILFDKLKGDFDKIDRSPILEMPQVIRDNEPGLRYAPHHIFLSEYYRFQIGPRSISLVCPNEYVGWTKFQEKIVFILEIIQEINLVKKALRTGLRYMNVFEGENVFENLKVDFSIDGNSLINESNSVRSEFKYSDFLCLLQISNQHSNQNKQQASIMDIDIVKDVSEIKTPDFNDIVFKSHIAEKEIFFSLLNNDYLKNNYNPEYGE